MRVLPLLLAGIAHAQTGGVTVELYDQSGNGGLLNTDTLEDFFGLARCFCGHTVRAEIGVNLLAVDDNAPVKIRGGSSCDSDDATVRERCAELDTFYVRDFAGTTQDVSFNLSELVPGCGASQKEMGIYALVDQGDDDEFEGVGARKFPVDTVRPGSPTDGGGPVPGDSAVVLSWDEPAGEDIGDRGGYQVFCSRGGSPVFPGRFEPEYRSTFTECGVQTGSTLLDDPDFLCGGFVSGRSARIGGLQNGSTYAFWVVAIDDMGNPSEELLDLGTAAPVSTEDFYEIYLRAGGEASGGFCAVNPDTGARGGPVLLVIVLGAALLWRVRRRAPLVLAICVATSTARAADDTYASPQNFAAEVKLGPYLPDVDGQFTHPDNHPYEDVFGNDPSLLTQFELDWQFLRTPVGSLGAGLLYGFFWESADAKSSVASADQTSLRVHTLGALAVVRVDALVRYLHVPLVPYAKLGLDYYIWWITEGDGSVANCPEDCPFAVDDPQDIKARGGAWGWQFSPGLALLLDVLDPRAAKILDSEMGVNHTYLFFEFLKADVDNFGGRAGKTLHLGDETWTAGLAFEF